MSFFSSIASAVKGVFGSPVGEAIAGGGATLLGGVLQNNSAKSQADEQMEFQERMSNTAYQRQMKDMELAGLNPILAAKVGGASTPSGSAAPVENVVAPAVSSAASLRMQALQAENLAQQNKKLQADTYQATTQGVLNDTAAAQKKMESEVYTKQLESLFSRAEIEGMIEKGKLDALKLVPLSSPALGAAAAAAPILGKAAQVGAAGVAAGTAAKLLPFSANSAKAAAQWRGTLKPPPFIK